MKKLFMSVTTFVAVLALCLVAACSTGIEGTYKFSSMKMEEGGISVDIKAGESYMGVSISEDAYVLEMKSDNTFELKINMGEETTASGTWEEKDGKYLLTSDGETTEAELNGNSLTFTMDGITLVMKK